MKMYYVLSYTSKQGKIWLIFISTFLSFYVVFYVFIYFLLESQSLLGQTPFSQELSPQC